MKFTQIPEDAFKQMQLNAGILLSDFTPSTGTLDTDDIIGATSGGVNFNATPSFKDLGEDIDNCPKNTKELKHLDTWDVKMSGSFATVTTALAKQLAGAADIDTVNTSKITPRNAIAASDFTDLWWVGDYSDKNEDGTSATAGFVAIHMLNSLSSGGFQIQTQDKEKGKFAFEFTAHYSITDVDEVPFEVYVKAGT